MLNPQAARLISALALVFAMVVSSGPAFATSPIAVPTAPPVSSGVIDVQNCSNVRSFCRGRHGRSPGYSQCVRNRGCRPRRARRNYCQTQYNRCARNYVVNRPPFRRCMANAGC